MNFCPECGRHLIRVTADEEVCPFHPMKAEPKPAPKKKRAPRKKRAKSDE